MESGWASKMVFVSFRLRFVLFSFFRLREKKKKKEGNFIFWCFWCWKGKWKEGKKERRKELVFQRMLRSFWVQWNPVLTILKGLVSLFLKLRFLLLTVKGHWGYFVVWRFSYVEVLYSEVWLCVDCVHVFIYSFRDGTWVTDGRMEG